MPPSDHFRSLARRPVSLRATIEVKPDTTGSGATLVDLGLGGACVETSAGLSVGQQVCVQLVAPNLWDPLRLEGEVAWQRPGEAGDRVRVGLRFKHDSSAPLLALVELIASNAYE